MISIRTTIIAMMCWMIYANGAPRSSDRIVSSQSASSKMDADNRRKYLIPNRVSPPRPEDSFSIRDNILYFPMKLIEFLFGNNLGLESALRTGCTKDPTCTWTCHHNDRCLCQCQL